MHRFIWNLAWGTSGVAESDEPDDGNGDVPRGPRVAPGKYLVELTVDGKTVPGQALTVLMDPRSPATKSDLQRQFDASYKMFADSLECRRALAELGSVQEQLSKIALPEGPGKTALAAKIASVISSIQTILSGNPETAGKRMGLEEANTALTAALHVSESSDRETPSQALIVYAQAHDASVARRKEWADLKHEALEQLNQQLKAQGAAPIAISEIEREVYYLMTR
jgi:hypothetical protein